MTKNLRAVLFTVLLGLASCAQAPAAPVEDPAPSAVMVPLDPTPRLAILAAYQPEIEALLPSLDGATEYQVNGVEFYTGKMEGVDVVVFLTKIASI
ncbi:MAG: hypothetical protein AAFY82_10935 [Pseudomonadota bacterium]